MSSLTYFIIVVAVCVLVAGIIYYLPKSGTPIVPISSDEWLSAELKRDGLSDEQIKWVAPLISPRKRSRKAKASKRKATKRKSVKRAKRNQGF